MSYAPRSSATAILARQRAHRSGGSKDEADANGDGERPDVMEAIRLLKLYSRQFPNEQPAQHWARMYLLVIPGYGARNSVEQRDARERLREGCAGDEEPGGT
jgi:hypothetical protein